VGAALAFIVGFLLYLRTMAPSLPFWDAGEFIAAAHTLGIPHSPGTPLYVLIGRVFTILPLPLSIAGKVNFLNVIFGTLGVLFVYVLVVRFLDYSLGKSKSVADTFLKAAGALVGAFFIAFSYTYWSNATEAEVYAMSVFFMGFITWLGLKWSANPTSARSVAYIYLLFYVLALTIGLHLGTVLAFSGVFLLVLMTKEKTFSNVEFLLACAGVAIFLADATLYRAGTVTLALLALLALALFFLYARTKSMFAIACCALFALGISVHLYLLIRSGLNPSIDEADPETWRNLYAVLRREQYPPPNVLVRKASFAFQLGHFNDYFQDQFKMLSAQLGRLNIGSVIPLALGIWGMVDQYAKSKRAFTVLFSTLLVVSLGMILYLNFAESEVRERDYFYLPAFYYFAVYIGIGVGSLISEVRRFVERHLPSRFGPRDHPRDGVPAQARWVKGLVPVIVPAALFLVLPFFTAHEHFHAHDRKGDRLAQAYAKNMLVGLDKDAIIFTFGDNDTFPLWYVQEVEDYRKDVRVVNLNLLNTPWYIRQLRDNEPRINIAWSDNELTRLRPVRTKDGWIQISAIGVQHILKHNSNDRPIYFSVTIEPSLYQMYRDFLEAEGLAQRVVPRKGKNMINVAKLEENVWQNYSYAGLLDENFKRDERVYQPPFVRRLCQNYSAAFGTLGFVKARDGNYAEAIRNLEAADEITPNLEDIVMWLGWYYLENGEPEKALTYYRDHIRTDPDNCIYRYRLAGVQEQIDDLQGAIETLDEMIRRCPDVRDAVVAAASISVRLGFVDRALRYLDTWIARHPNDDALRNARDEIVNRARQDSTLEQ
jgi:tetratricopeptide (TPR) repeat protein